MARPEVTGRKQVNAADDADAYALTNFARVIALARSFSTN
jgi:hypothetical protein